MEEFGKYLKDLDVETEKVNSRAAIVNTYLAGNGIISGLDLDFTSTHIIDTRIKLRAINNYSGYCLYKQFKEMPGIHHSKPKALLHGSKLYREAGMITVDSVFELFDAAKIKDLLAHAEEYEELEGGFYDKPGIRSYGRHRHYSAALEAYRSFLFPNA